MNIEKYKVFLTAARKGSFIQAARELGYTPSAVTQMMNSLENECGFSLLQRSNKGVVLTKEGHAILPYARQLVEVEERLEEQCENIKGIHLGRLRIAGFTSTACAIILPVVERFQERYPNIDVDILEENSPKTLAEWVRSGVADITITTKQPDYENEWIILNVNPYVAVLSKQNPLSRNECITAEEMQQSRVLMFRSRHGLESNVAEYMKKYSLQPLSTFTSNCNYVMLKKLEQTPCVSLLPVYMWDFYAPMHPGLTARPISPSLTCDIILTVASFSECSVPARAFIECTKEFIKDSLT